MVHRLTAALAAATIAVVTTAGPAAANATTDVAAFTRYAAVAREDAAANAADATASAGDNLTCDPQPVVDGRMLNPRVGVVVGEVHGQAEIAAHWKCVSLDTGAVYEAYGVVTHWYYNGITYVPDEHFVSQGPSRAGAATVNPAGVPRYVGGSPALNTWHFARFVGTTTTGRTIRGVSPLFYVAGV